MDPLKEALRRYQEITLAQEKDRQEAYGALRRDLVSVNEGQNKLRDETKNLADALSKPQVKGRWGEIALRRIVEVSGMSEYCDFEEQVSINTVDGRLRPDLIIKLPGNKTVIVHQCPGNNGRRGVGERDQGRG